MMKLKYVYIKKNLRTNTIDLLYYPIELAEHCRVWPLILLLGAAVQSLTIMLSSFKIVRQPFGEMSIWHQFESLCIHLISTGGFSYHSLQSVVISTCYNFLRITLTIPFMLPILLLHQYKRSLHGDGQYGKCGVGEKKKHQDD